MPHAGALAYLKRHPEEDKPELFFAGTRSLKYAALEHLDRLAFIEFAQHDPWFVVETFTIVKGKMIWTTLIDAIKAEWSNASGRARLQLGAAIIIIASIAAGHPGRFQNLMRLGAVAAIGAIVSLRVPVLTLVVPQTMTEQVMAIEIATILLFSLLVAYIIRAAIRYLAISKQASAHVLADYQLGQPRFQNAYTQSNAYRSTGDSGSQRHQELGVSTSEDWYSPSFVRVSPGPCKKLRPGIRLGRL